MNAVRLGYAALVGSVLALFAAPVLAQPANDECAGAINVGEGQFSFDLTGATNSIISTCDDPTIDPVPDVWFRYAPSGNGSAIVTTCGLVDFLTGTTISVYSNSCTSSQIICKSNTCENGQATVNFVVTAGSHFRIRIASADGSEISGQFSITLIPRCTTPPPGAPANDCCSTATNVGNGTFAFTTVGATRDYAGPCDQLNPNPDVWFNYTATSTGFAKVRPAIDAPQDIGVTVLDGSCTGNQIACDSDFLFEDDTRQVVFPTVATHHYLIRLHGVAAPTASGHIVFSVATPPANDNCTTATHITGVGSFPFDNTLANDSGPDNNLACDSFLGGPAIAKDVWFRWTSNLPAGQDAVASTCGGTRVDTKMAVYSDGCPPSVPLDCNDDYCFNQSQVRWSPTPGASYLIRIGNWPGFENQPGPDGKPGTFTIESAPTCTLTAPPGALVEPEACGDTTNDGCDFGLFTDLPCGTTTVFGTAPVIGGLQDLDIYRMVFPVPTHVTVIATAEFPMALAILDDECPPFPLDSWRFASGICDDPQLNPLDIDLPAGTFLFGVANTRADSPCDHKNHYLLTITVGACEPSGRCCMHASCTVMLHSACLSAGGSYGGDDTVCPPPGGSYIATSCSTALEDISATGAPGTPCSSYCGDYITLPFSVTYYGTAYTQVGVSVNGFLTFSTDTSLGNGTSLTLPDPSAPLFVAPFWDSMDTDPASGAGSVYTQVLGTAPNRRFVALWKNVQNYLQPGTQSTFEAILHEGSTDIDFRYGSLNTEFASPHIGVSDGAGKFGLDLPLASLGTCQHLTLAPVPNPCCRADFNSNGQVTVQDFFDFLGAFFLHLPSADVNNTGSVTVQDLFDFLGLWFARC